MNTYRFGYALIGEELNVLKSAVIEVDDEGRVVGVGTQASSISVNFGKNTILIPQLVNSHIHILDYRLSRYYDKYWIDDVVGTPYGIKYQYLRKVKRRDLTYLEELFWNIKQTGTGCVVPFIEYGLRYVDFIIKLAEKYRLSLIPFLEPSHYRLHISSEDEVYDELVKEVKNIVERRFNVALISPLNYTIRELEHISKLAHDFKVKIGTHISETEDTYLEDDLSRALTYLKPDLAIHLTQLRGKDLDKLPKGLGVVITPRANSIFIGKLPPLYELLRNENIYTMLGTDNVGVTSWNIIEEVHYLYHVSKLMRIPISHVELLKLCTVNPSRFWRIDYGIIKQEVKIHGVVIRTIGELDVDDVYKYLVVYAGVGDFVALVDENVIIEV